MVTGAQTEARASAVGIDVHGVELPAPTAGGAGLALDAVSVKNGSFDLTARRVGAAEVSISGGDVSIARDADGTLDWVRRFASAGPDRAIRTARATADPWRYDIARIGVDGIDLALADRGVSPPFSYGLRIASTAVRNVSDVAGTVMPLKTRPIARPGGTLDLQGHVAANGSGLQAQVHLDKLALAPFRPLAERYTGFAVAGGPLTLTAQVRDAGGLAVDDLQIDLPDFTLRRAAADPRAEPLFTAAQLRVQDAQVQLAQHRIVVGRLQVAHGGLRARVAPDGRLDWTAAPGKTPAAAVLPSLQGATAPAAPWRVRIEALNVGQMAAHYSDLSRREPLRLYVGRFDVETALEVSVGGSAPQFVAEKCTPNSTPRRSWLTGGPHRPCRSRRHR